jgi:hypothetical protein
MCIGIIAGVAALTSTGASDARSALRDKVWEVVQRTKTTRATYTTYVWNWIKGEDGSPPNPWRARFHDGDRARLEGWEHRSIADCGSGRGVAISNDPKGRHAGASVGRYTCGIDTTERFKSAAYLGLVDTPWGRADRIRLVVGQTARVYDVDKEGIVVGETWYDTSPYATRPADRVILHQTIFAVLHTVPSHDMFEERSLRKAYTPAQFQAPPKL